MMADTLLDAESEAPAEADSQTSDPSESKADVAPETEGTLIGDPPAKSDAEETPSKDSEEDQDEAEEAAPEGEEPSFDGLELGEHSPLTEEHVEGLVEFAVANNLTPEVAQAILGRDEARAIKADETWAATVEGWEQEFRADKDFGGKNLDASVANARAAMAKFGPPGWIQSLNESGFGNNPELLRFAASVGAKMSEADKMVNGNSASSDSKPTWNTLFPESGAPPSERSI